MNLYLPSKPKLRTLLLLRLNTESSDSNHTQQPKICHVSQMKSKALEFTLQQQPRNVAGLRTSETGSWPLGMSSCTQACADHQDADRRRSLTPFLLLTYYD